MQGVETDFCEDVLLIPRRGYGQFEGLSYQRIRKLRTFLRGNQLSRFGVFLGKFAYRLGVLFYLRLASVLILILLTNPLSAQLRPDPSSLIHIHYERKDCQNFGEGGVGCRKAILQFSLTTVRVQGEWVDVVFHSEGGAWTGTVRYSPALCSPLSGDLWVCKEVSWRVAE